ncbi:ABC transporter ATP-binding protein [Streptomyces sp. MS2.AVA.5]|uniref:ABC transporter ATP-binding protein n=1 Tax=Streptomyces achmelvichensis TaxID=3134111 RepID=A0ACC6PM82_9ACTN
MRGIFFFRETGEPGVLIRRVFALLGPYRWVLAAAVGIEVLSSLLVVAPPLLVGRLVNQVAQGAGTHQLVGSAAALAAVALAGGALSLAGMWFATRLAERMVRDLRVRVFTHVQGMPLAFFARARTGALVNRLTGDLDGVGQACASILSGIVGSVLTLILAGSIMLALSWHVTLAAFLAAVFLIAIARRAGRRMADLTRRHAQAEARLASTLTERFTVNGALLVKLFGLSGTEIRHIGQQSHEVAGLTVRVQMSAQRFGTALALVFTLTQTLAYALGGILAGQHIISTGTVITLSLLLTHLHSPIASLSHIRIQLATTRVGFERIFEVLDLPTTPSPSLATHAGNDTGDHATTPDKPHGATTSHTRERQEKRAPVPPALTKTQPVATPSSLAPRFNPDHIQRTRSRAHPSPNRTGRVEFRHVSFRHPTNICLPSLEDGNHSHHTPNPPVLHDICLTLHPGQTTALVGPSGAGKTTLALLIPRIHTPTSGTILIDDTDTLPLDQLRARIGVVTQHTHLFHETLANNLRYARPDAGDHQLHHALERAYLSDLLHTLPQGLDTIVGEGGHHLSGGEKQRLAIARVILKNPDIIILDEATAHLDSLTEAAIQHALTRTLAHRTALVIAHRLSTIHKADHIVVLHQGTITEQGTHTRLLAQNGHYSRMHHKGLSG